MYWCSVRAHDRYLVALSCVPTWTCFSSPRPGKRARAGGGVLLSQFFEKHEPYFILVLNRSHVAAALSVTFADEVFGRVPSTGENRKYFISFLRRPSRFFAHACVLLFDLFFYDYCCCFSRPLTRAWACLLLTCRREMWVLPCLPLTCRRVTWTLAFPSLTCPPSTSSRRRRACSASSSRRSPARLALR